MCAPMRAPNACPPRWAHIPQASPTLGTSPWVPTLVPPAFTAPRDPHSPPWRVSAPHEDKPWGRQSPGAQLKAAQQTPRAAGLLTQTLHTGNPKYWAKAGWRVPTLGPSMGHSSPQRGWSGAEHVGNVGCDTTKANPPPPTRSYLLLKQKPEPPSLNPGVFWEC